MKNNRGITLTSLAITILIMLIISGATIYSGIESINLAKETTFNNELKIIHAKVNEIAERKLSEAELSQYGQSIEKLDSKTKGKIQTAMQEESLDGFRFFSKENLEAIGASGIDRKVIINFSTREVVDINGIKTDKGYIYRMEGWNKVKYTDDNTNAPTFNLSKKVYGLTASIQVVDIEYKNNVGKGTIYLGKIENESGNVFNWKTVGTNITVDETGVYRIKIEDAAGNVAEKEIEIVTCNKPKLADGMTPVVYDKSLGKWKVVEETSGDWFDYASDEKKWANVMLQDGLQVNDDGVVEQYGSMFVWVPRYMYSIPSSSYRVVTNKPEFSIKFLKGNSNVSTDGVNVAITNACGADNWNVHPGFTFGTQELTGIWSAKFEASMQEANKNTVADNNMTNKTVKIVPNAENWRFINIGNMFMCCYNMKEKQIYGLKGNADTHLMKNVEWGALTYLATSKYGVIPTINSRYETYVEGGVTKEHSYCAEGDYKTNVSQSTTGNITGVYDMNGGVMEYVAAYWDNTDAALSTHGSTRIFPNNKLAATYEKYWDKYEVSQNEIIQVNSGLWNKDKTFNNIRKQITDERYNLMKAKIGDAIYEVTNTYSYFGKREDEVYDCGIDEKFSSAQYGLAFYNDDWIFIGNTGRPFVHRGGYWKYGQGCGIFSSIGDVGVYGSGIGFRPVLVIK